MIGVCVTGLVLLWALVVHPFLRVAAGYSATITATQYFATGDSLETILEERIPSKIGFVNLVVDEEERAVEATALYVTSRAVFREHLGATREETRRVDLDVGVRDLVPEPPSTLAWPRGSSRELRSLSTAVDRERLESALTAAMAEGTGTHAVAVVHAGGLVAERYADGYDRATPFLGWSMTKSVTATLLGRLAHLGEIEVEAPTGLAAWAGDARAEITFEDLLRMRSGLEFYQDHATPFCNSLHMLFVSADCAGFAASKSMAHPRGETWYYSDGTSNILAGLVVGTSAVSPRERLETPQRLLFAPLGMDSAFIGVDGSGTFVGSSLMYASARDWARFGLLYARDGVWEGERLLPIGWVDFVAEATPNSSGRRYGAHFWRYETGPDAGVISAQGYQGQFVFIDRARDVVLVRLGVNPVRFDDRAFARAILGSFPMRADR